MYNILIIINNIMLKGAAKRSSMCKCNIAITQQSLLKQFKLMQNKRNIDFSVSYDVIIC